MRQIIGAKISRNFPRRPQIIVYLNGSHFPDSTQFFFSYILPFDAVDRGTNSAGDMNMNKSNILRCDKCKTSNKIGSALIRVWCVRLSIVAVETQQSILCMLLSYTLLLTM